MLHSTRRFAILIGIAVLCVSLGYSQGMRRMTPEQRVDSLAKQLSLSDVQKGQVLGVFQEADSLRQQAFQQHQGDRDAMRAAMDSSRTLTSAKLKTILTEEQFEKYQKLLEQMPMRRRGMNQ